MREWTETEREARTEGDIDGRIILISQLLTTSPSEIKRKNDYAKITRPVLNPRQDAEAPSTWICRQMQMFPFLSPLSNITYNRNDTTWRLH